ncbi:hypothetical protein FDG2_0608 [Candidatus Protofrankia californiensis]|uniref:Uncharacterized protein n=1 Tax=Candidatus Protofrankia californiensis TaxID=1839754 RepID=A0A1C3NTX4_9ACTN|nr:hypothetical protein FDG2_0608 [Candidatus Protofrankia californiensis]
MVSGHLRFSEMIQAELEAKGFERHRLFNSRVLVEIRCPKKGHVLGAIYPTRMGPLLSGVVAKPPRPISRAERERIQREFPFEIDFRRDRDAYEIDYSNPDVDLVAKPPTALLEWPHDSRVAWFWDLWCRCGRIPIFLDELREALEQQGATGDLIVFVPPC